MHEEMMSLRWCLNFNFNFQTNFRLSLFEGVFMEEAKIIGKSLKATLLVMGELGSLGHDVLSSHGIKEIDVDKLYPRSYLKAINETIFQKYGSDAFRNFGFTVGELYSMPSVDSVMPSYRDEIEQSGPTQKALDLFMENFSNDYDKNSKFSIRHDAQEYGFTSRSMGSGIFEIEIVGVNFYHATSEGVMQRNIFHYISSDWDHTLIFHPEKTTSGPNYFALHFTLSFKAKKDRSISSSELKIAYQLQLKESLLKKVIEDSNRSLSLIMASVNYASRLQRGQLPRQEKIATRFASFSALWEPRDTIGGDLYWLSSSQQSGRFVLAVSDSTGHGVPGAMLSLLVSNSLERIYAKDTIEDPAAALMSLDHYLRAGLNQDRAGSESNDGCDAAVLRIDRDKKTIEFAGAKLGLFQVSSDGLLTRHTGSRCSLGYQDAVIEADKPVLKTIGYSEGDIFAIVTDGLTDQIGGASGKTSYGYRRLEEVLKANCAASAEEITGAMKSDFAAWQGTNARRDDVTAVVFRL